MKLLKKATYAIVLAFVILFTYQCSGSKALKFEESASFKVKPIYFQEWYAGIKIGGTGINVFVPVVNKNDNISIDSVYFRNLKGKLIHKNDRYFAMLKNNSPNYTFKKTEKGIDYPFILTDNECAISYVENGETKYVKVTEVSEVEGTYYENGPPSIYKKTSSTVVATAHEEDE